VGNLKAEHLKIMASAEELPMTMLAHCVKTLDESPAVNAGEEWKADAFENMNKNVAVHNVVEGAASVEKKEEKSFKIVMIRHGESEWNKENRFCGWFDAGLSEVPPRLWPEERP